MDNMEELIAKTNDPIVLQWLLLGLGLSCAALFTVVIYFFKKDMESTNKQIELMVDEQNSQREVAIAQSEVQIRQGKDMESMMQLVRSNQEQTNQMLRILSRQTGVE